MAKRVRVRLVRVPENQTVKAEDGTCVPSPVWMDRLEKMVKHGIRRATELGAQVAAYYIW